MFQPLPKNGQFDLGGRLILTVSSLVHDCDTAPDIVSFVCVDPPGFLIQQALCPTA